MPEITLHFSDGAEMKPVHSIPAALPKGLRMDQTGFIKEG